MKVGKTTILLLAFAATQSIAAQDESIRMSSVGQWDDITSYTINAKENRLIIARASADGTTKVFETRKSGDTWQPLTPITPINNKVTATTNIGGLSLTYNESRLYFHATFAEGKGGSDIYYIDMVGGDWSEPTLVEELSTALDEESPAPTPNEQRIYFLRHDPNPDAKQEKRNADKLSIFEAKRNNEKNTWDKIQPAFYTLNEGFVQDVSIAPDGATILYSQRPKRNEASVATLAQMSQNGIPTKPAALFIDDANCDYYAPQCLGSNTYMIRSDNKKHQRIGSIIAINTPKSKKLKPYVNENFTITDKDTKSNTEAKVLITNAITSEIVGTYQSSASNGNISFALPADNNYLVEINKENYTTASYQLNYKQDAKPTIPQNVELTNKIELIVSAFDKETYQSVDCKVVAIESATKTVIRTTKKTDGTYTVFLPIGRKYNLLATATNYADNSQTINLATEILQPKLTKEIALEAKTANVTIKVSEAQNGKPLNADITIRNTATNETKTISQNEMQGGNANVGLRMNNTYEIFAEGLKGYSFNSTLLQLKDAETEIVEIELAPLGKKSTIKSRNIVFADNSAKLMPCSFGELDKVAEMLKGNAQAKVAIAVKALQNKQLQTKQANEILQYIADSGVDAKRLSIDSEASSQNVEFRIVGND